MLQKIVFSSYSLSLVVVTFLRAKVHYYFETRKKIGRKVLEKVTIEGGLYFTSPLYAFSDITFVPLDLPRPTVYPIRIVYELVHFRNDL